MRGGRVCAVEWIYFFVPTYLGGTFATGCWVGGGLPGLLGVVGVLGLLGLLGPVLRLLVLGVLVLGVVALGARGGGLRGGGVGRDAAPTDVGGTYWVGCWLWGS